MTCVFSRIDLSALCAARDPINLAGSGPVPVEPRGDLMMSERQEQLVAALWALLAAERLSDGLSSLMATAACAIEQSHGDTATKSMMLDKCCDMLAETAEALRRGLLVRSDGEPFEIGRGV